MTQGVKFVNKTLADGTTRRYAYDRATGKRISGDPDSETFLDHLAIIRAPIVIDGEAPVLVRADERDYDAPLMIYFIQAASGPVKIGITDNVARRISRIRNTLWEDCVLLAVFRGDRRLEKRLHYSLKRHRLRNDWFAPHSHVMRAIQELAGDPKAQVQKLREKPGNRVAQPIG